MVAVGKRIAWRGANTVRHRYPIFFSEIFKIAKGNGRTWRRGGRARQRPDTKSDHEKAEGKETAEMKYPAHERKLGYVSLQPQRNAKCQVVNIRVIGHIPAVSCTQRFACRHSVV